MYLSNAIIYRRYGPPEEVLELSKDRPCLSLLAGELRVRLLASPIHPSDMGMINGSYGRLEELPAVAGREGVGEIVEVGPEVQGFSLGDWVIFLPKQPGTWQDYLSLQASELIKIPKNLPIDQAAMALINPPTAWLLLTQFLELQKGDWLIQNAAHSSVGQLVIQLAKEKGVHTLNVVRDLAQAPHLLALGGDVVLAEGSSYWKEIAKHTQGAPIRLALNSIGGPSAVSLMRSLSYGGTLVTFGGMSSELIKFPTKSFIFNDLRLVGFWYDHWRRAQTKDTLDALYTQILERMSKGQLKMPIGQIYSLASFQAALLHASQAGKNGKILFAGFSNA